MLFVSDDVEILNIGDSKRARRIIDGTLEGRNILNTLTQMGYLNKNLYTKYERGYYNG